MGLSSNILWHQTDEKGFYGIMDSKQLYYSYSLETIKAADETLVEAFPMISLSDLPFAELDFYLNCEKYDSNDAKFKTYGGYIFGFKRSWGIRNKFSPVWYCETYHEGLYKILTSWKSRRKDEFLYHLIGNIKNNEGELPKANADVYRFYNEREYRRLLEDGHLQTLTKDEYQQYKSEHGGSSLLSPRCGVAFTASELQYIIVPNDYAREQFYQRQTEEWCRIPVFTRDEVNQNFIGIRHHHIKGAVDEPKEKEHIPVRSISVIPNSIPITKPKTSIRPKEWSQSFEIPGLNPLNPMPDALKAVTEAIAKSTEALRAFSETFDWLKSVNEKYNGFCQNLGLTPKNKDIGNSTAESE